MQISASFAMIAALLVTSFPLPLSARPVPSLASHPASSEQPDFAPSVYIFNPNMPQGEIQATVDALASQQVSNQFGTQRYALLFQPGTYGSSTNPLNFQVGYYTTVAGLASPQQTWSSTVPSTYTTSASAPITASRL